MKISKGLVIAEPWIGYILDGGKTWEMRSTAASHRGWFALIRKGSGLISGVARLVDVGLPLSPSEMVGAFERHRIPEPMIRSGEVAGWNIPWKLADVRRLDHPVPYAHKSGAVTWVALDTRAIEAVDSQLAGHETDFDLRSLEACGWATQPATSLASGDTIDIEREDGQLLQASASTVHLPAGPASVPVAQVADHSGESRIGEVALTEGNIANNHIYLRSFFDRFPAEVIGGSNKASRAKHEVTIEWGGPEPVVTDLDGSKKFFRARAWIGAFFELNRAKAGDRVVVFRTAPYRYRVRLENAASWGEAA